MSQEINNANEGDLEFRAENGIRYLVQFPVGDWSDDGHNKCNYYFALSDKPVREIREAHYRATEVVGFSIGDICRDYGDDTFNLNVRNVLIKMGYTFNLSDINGDEVHPTTEEIFNVWIFLLNRIEPSLNLKRIRIPSINYYGCDSRGRHLETPGYGLFE